MYLDETYTFKMRRKGTMLIASLLLLSVVCPTLASQMRTCPENCRCYVDSDYSPYSLNTAECDNLVWKSVYYPSILQLKLRPAPNASQCHIANFTARLFPKLQKLNLSNCSLTSVPPSGANKFENLYWIDVSNNSIRSLPSNALHSYLHISQFMLSNNPLNPHAPPALDSPMMNQLVMDSCGIRTLPAQTFSGMPKLKYLSLANNNISFVHEKTFPIGLVDLDLSNNKIVNVPMNEFLRLRNLSLLNLFANPVNCTCELVRFQDWLSTKTLFVNGMVCAYPHKYAGRKSSHIREDDLCSKKRVEDSSSSQENCIPTKNSICNNGAVIDQDYPNDQAADENELAYRDDQLIPANSDYVNDEPAADKQTVEGSGEELETDKTPISGQKEEQESISKAPEFATSHDTTTEKNDVLKSMTELNSSSANNSSDSSVVVDSTTNAISINSTTAPSQDSPNNTSENPSTEASSTSPAPSNTSSESAPTEPPSSVADPLSNSTSGNPSIEPENTSPASSNSSESAPPEPQSGVTDPSNNTSENPPIEPENTSSASSSVAPEIPPTEPSSNVTAPSNNTSEISSVEPSSAASEIPVNQPESKVEASSSTIPDGPSEEVTEATTTPSAPTNISQNNSGEKETALTAGDKQEHLHSSESKTMYGYLIPGLAVLLIGLVCLAVYCSQCASKVATYKQTETSAEGAELQEVSLLPENDRPTIVKRTNKYPGEKENGQTERLMSEDHERTNGGGAIIAEVNGNGSQHSDETIECCKLANGQSVANQNDLGNVECTIVKVTTLPDSVPKTAVIRDL